MLTPSPPPPRLRRQPPGNTGRAVALARIMAALGAPPDPWQADALVAMMPTRPDGSWAASRSGVSVCRQQGKGWLIEALVLDALLVRGERVVWTAHLVQTAANGFERLLAYFESPELSGLVRRIVRTNGREAVYLHNGGSVRLVSRSKSSGRGLSADLLILDEAQELSDETFAALLPVVSASPSPRVALFGSPVTPAADGTVFTRFRDSAIAGLDDDLAWVEYGAEPTDDFNDEAVWAKACPALGHRLRVETVRAERAAMEDRIFGAERLGIWYGDALASVIPAEVWQALEDDEDPVSRPVFAVDVSPDRSRAAIAVAAYLDDGRISLQLAASGDGTAWVAERLAELKAKHRPHAIVLDSVGPASSLLRDMRRAHVGRITELSTTDVVRASADLYDAVTAGTITHPGEPRLDAAVSGATRRKVGEGWAWDRRGDADITPLVAATFARFALTRYKRPGESAPSITVIQ
ncbi:terminase large subunit [Nocardioides ultimimeridianus]